MTFFVGNKVRIANLVSAFHDKIGVIVEKFPTTNEKWRFGVHLNGKIKEELVYFSAKELELVQEMSYPNQLKELQDWLIS